VLSKTSVIGFNSMVTKQKISAAEVKESQKNIARLFRQPMLQPGLVDLCSYFDWKLGKAKITPALGNVTIEPAFFEMFEDNFKKLPETANYVQKPLGKVDMGAFKVKGDWTLTLGLPCGHFLEGSNSLLKKWFLDLQDIDYSGI
jgi:hypothetical protein